MKKILSILALLCFSFLLLLSCAKRREMNANLDNCPVVASKVNDLITLDYSLVKDTCDFPISALLSSYDIIHLENSDEALVGQSYAFAMSDNYIGLYTDNPPQYKLFYKSGKFVCNLSANGQGPDEFLFGICDSYIDEKNGKVYLLSYMAKKLLVFDLNGNSFKHIPFPFTVHKGRFIINEEKQELTMFALPFIDTPYAIWKQDFSGNVLQSISSTPFIIDPGDYSNEVNFSLNTNKTDYSLFHWWSTQDSIYHYNEQENILGSVFTVKWTEDEIMRHSYVEIPGYYCVTIVTETSTPTSTPNYPHIFIDKSTLKGSFVNIKFDMLGNIDGHNHIFFDRGYCIVNMYPYQLKEQLRKALAQPDKLTLEMKYELIKLNNSITEDDNNILFIGKQKTN